jgi:hypothetical protein
MDSISVLTHENDSFWDVDYVVRRFIPVWEEMGLRVEVLQGTEGKIGTDAVLLHIDLTVIPPEYVDYLAGFPVVLNGKPVDISKRTISSNLIERDSDYQGPVIVKTDLNYGGVPERVREGRPLLERAKNRAKRALPWPWSGVVPEGGYPVFESPSEVPKAVWTSSDWVVEKFQPEMEDGQYCLRQWVFLGDKDMHLRSFSESHIVKAGNVVRYEELQKVPEELRDIRDRLGFDYGKFDYGLVDGQVVLYDANRTPASSPSKERTPNTERLENLAKGILSFGAP